MRTHSEWLPPPSPETPGLRPICTKNFIYVLSRLTLTSQERVTRAVMHSAWPLKAARCKAVLQKKQASYSVKVNKSSACLRVAPQRCQKQRPAHVRLQNLFNLSLVSTCAPEASSLVSSPTSPFRAALCRLDIFFCEHSTGLCVHRQIQHRIGRLYKALRLFSLPVRTVRTVSTKRDDF